MEHQSDGNTSSNWCAWYSRQRINENNGTEGLGNKRTNGDNPNDSVIKISQFTEKSPADLKRITSTSGRPLASSGVKNSRNNNNNNNNDNY